MTFTATHVLARAVTQGCYGPSRWPVTFAAGTPLALLGRHDYIEGVAIYDVGPCEAYGGEPRLLSEPDDLTLGRVLSGTSLLLRDEDVLTYVSVKIAGPEADVPAP